MSSFSLNRNYFRFLRTYSIPEDWLLFTRVSISLFVGYFVVGWFFAADLAPYLKGLNTMQHFAIHYSVGIFFGFLIYFSCKFLLQKTLDLGFLLAICVIFSHWPDVMFLFHRGPHPSWMIIFFFHTVVDNTFWSFPLFLLADIAFVALYLKVKK